jgi:tRNA pseudouridine55 synthase
VRCSKGTYIRSLAFDLGRAVGAGAHLTALRRTRSGPFHIDAAHRPEEIATAPLVGLSQALAHLPVLHADGASARRLEQGQRVARAALEPHDHLDGVAGNGPGSSTAEGRFQVVRADGSLLAVAELADDATLRTLRVFN